MGHVLGFEDITMPDQLMTEVLETGVRCAPAPVVETGLTALAGPGWAFGLNRESMTFSDRMAVLPRLDSNVNAASNESRKSAEKLVSMTVRKGMDAVSAAVVEPGKDWLFDFLMNGGKESNPNAGINILL